MAWIRTVPEDELKRATFRLVERLLLMQGSYVFKNRPYVEANECSMD